MPSASDFSTLGNWGPCSYAVVKKVGPSPAIMLAYLISCKERFSKDADWFFRTTDEIENDLGWKPRSQQYILQKLEDKNLIRRDTHTQNTKQGHRKNRLFCIEWDEIKELVESVKEESHVQKTAHTPCAKNGTSHVQKTAHTPCAKNGTISTRKTKRNNYTSSRVKPATGSSCENNLMEGLVNEFIEGLKNKDIKISINAKQKWPIQLKRIFDEYDTNEKELTDVLRFHIKNLGTPFHPKAYCAKSFIRSFPVICEKYSKPIGGEAATGIETVEVSEEAKKLAEEYSHWPTKNLDQIIQQSLDAMAPFKKKVTSLYKRESAILAKKDEFNSNDLYKVESCLATYHRDLNIRSWLRYINWRYSNWSEWRGHIPIWDFQEKLCIEFMEHIAKQNDLRKTAPEDLLQFIREEFERRRKQKRQRQ